MKKTYAYSIALILAFAVAYAGIQASASGHIDVVKSFDATVGELPEGIAIDKPGNIYVSLGPPFFVGGGYGAVLKQRSSPSIRPDRLPLGWLLMHPATFTLRSQTWVVLV